LTIDSFLKRTRKKSIFDIELLDGTDRRNNNAENCTNGVRLANWRKSFIIVKALLLRITTTYPSSFIASKATIGMKFLTKTHFLDIILVLEG
jgi:hypothetical protein